MHASCRQVLVPGNGPLSATVRFCSKLQLKKNSVAPVPPNTHGEDTHNLTFRLLKYLSYCLTSRCVSTISHPIPSRGIDQTSKVLESLSSDLTSRYVACHLSTSSVDGASSLGSTMGSPNTVINFTRRGSKGHHLSIQFD